MERAQLITLDWGTSNLRAHLLGPHGALWQTRSAPGGGILAVPAGGFESALRTLCGDWIAAHRCPLIASGMIGSQQGWHETPYLDCPATLADAAQQLTALPLGTGAAAATLYIAPGLRCSSGSGIGHGHDKSVFDVMRGEETQVWGAALAAGACCVLPGTHSKWVWLGEGGAVEHFQTHMTGEFYALLTQHGILGRLMSFGDSAPDVFAEGARLGQQGHATLMHAVFAARTAALMQQLPPTALPDFLSGMLIGAEIGGALATAKVSSVALLGDAALCERYASVFALACVPCTRIDDGATTRGQWQLAQHAGLVDG